MPELACSVLLDQHGQSLKLAPGFNDAEVREGQCLFRIDTATPVSVTFDDAPVRVVWSEGRTVGFGQLDLTNQVGFHRFVLAAAGREVRFDFGTTTAKATWSELQAMARVVSDQVFSFRRQFVYSTVRRERRAVRVPEVESAWLRDRLPELHDLVERIDRRPATNTRQTFRVSHEARHVSIPHTLRLVREQPGLLEASPGGPLVVSGKEYWPAAVVVRDREREPARIEHTQLAHFLALVARLVARLGADAPHHLVDALTRWTRDVAYLRGRGVVRRYDLPNAHLAWASVPTALQRVDERYRRVRALHAEFLQDVEIGDPSPDSVRINVRDAWEIYQAFVAQMVGRALGLQHFSRRGDLRERSPRGYSMASDDVELYYDARPPDDVVTSWRDSSARAADERPDVLLFHKRRRAVAVLDAKFRVERDGVSAKNEDLFEMQGYMNSFNLNAGAIVFPGKERAVRRIAGGSILLLELPVRADAFDGDAQATLLSLSASIESLWCPRPDARIA